MTPGQTDVKLSAAPRRYRARAPGHPPQMRGTTSRKHFHLTPSLFLHIVDNVAVHMNSPYSPQAKTITRKAAPFQSNHAQIHAEFQPTLPPGRTGS